MKRWHFDVVTKWLRVHPVGGFQDTQFWYSDLIAAIKSLMSELLIPFHPQINQMSIYSDISEWYYLVLLECVMIFSYHMQHIAHVATLPFLNPTLGGVCITI